jgi:hypothetical protein
VLLIARQTPSSCLTTFLIGTSSASNPELRVGHNDALSAIQLGLRSMRVCVKDIFIEGDLLLDLVDVASNTLVLEGRVLLPHNNAPIEREGYAK